MTGKMILKVITFMYIFYHVINSQWFMFKKYYWKSHEIQTKYPTIENMLRIVKSF